MQRTILCFGDSNTHGTRAMRQIGDQRRFGHDARWPSIMAAALGDGYEVIPEGLPGRTTVFSDPVEGAHKCGMTALPVLLETHWPVDLVIVMLGTNDTKKRFSLSAFDIALGIEKLIEFTRQSAAGPGGIAPAILLASPVPVLEAGFLAPLFEGGASKSRELGALAKEVAERQGAAFLDLADIAEVDPTDGIHLTAEAQQAIGRAMTQAVQEIFAKEQG